MQDVPALLASLHGLSTFEDQGEWTRDHARDREQAARGQQERERKEQQELDRAAALRLKQHQQRREEDERRRAMQAAAAKARQEKLEHEQRHTARTREEQAAAARTREEEADRAYQQSPTTFQYEVQACIAATSAEITRMIAASQARTRHLEQDLATKLREEASRR
jgi:colicin import membrane protein